VALERRDIKCPACGARDLAEVRHRFRREPGTIEYLQCRDCGERINAWPVWGHEWAVANRAIEEAEADDNATADP